MFCIFWSNSITYSVREPRFPSFWGGARANGFQRDPTWPLRRLALRGFPIQFEKNPQIIQVSALCTFCAALASGSGSGSGSGRDGTGRDDDNSHIRKQEDRHDGGGDAFALVLLLSPPPVRRLRRSSRVHSFLPPARPQKAGLGIPAARAYPGSL